MFDIIVIGQNNCNWDVLKRKFPLLKKAESFREAQKKSLTEMFWVVWDDLVIDNDFNFEYEVPDWDKKYIHIFKNSIYDDGVCLAPKNLTVTDKELNHRFFLEKKIIDKSISVPQEYDKFLINTYDEYLEALDSCKTDMFWGIWNDITILENFKFDYHIPYYDTFHRNITHVFKNGKHYDGVCLFSKNNKVSKKEFEYRFFTEKKEVDIIASLPKQFEIHNLKTYEDYLSVIDSCSTEMFWGVWNDVEISEDFTFDYYIPKYDSFHRNITHVFKNGEHYDGICLFSKNIKVTKKEFDHRFFVEKNEIDIVASQPKKYDKFIISNYEDYLNAYETSSSEMFWIIPKEVVVDKNFNFDLYFSHHNSYDRSVHHGFKHKFRNEENYNGITLVTRQHKLSKREIDFRFIIEKKEWDILASSLKPYDIIFISYNEPNADENYQRIKQKFLRTKRVHGVKGIHQAHIKAAELSDTDMFYVVDGDAVIEEEFKFDYEVPVYDKDTVHVWRSRNPINGLEYGYGGVKLLPKKLTIDMDITTTDMTMSISSKFKVIDEISNITAFNTDAFNTWRSAFRECCKLAVINDSEALSRLQAWTQLNENIAYGAYAYIGAIAGKSYGETNVNNLDALKLINDFDWLYEKFSKNTF